MIRFKLKEMIAEKEFSEKRRITVKEISDKTNINRMTLSKILNHPGHSTTTENIDRLCKFFDCEVEDLMKYIREDI
ncbi:transcriptional regulator [Hydrogenovibrio sp. SC-1]|uniref:helix-turn-helix domain-containing protein n=1 Tax=Hydrogenovibrio sp. SC-1 TaxID=2065820 RepID=UPI000C79B38E|nr:transcriptional regulator [Hydrogenovibrio sp. SC-1]